MTTPITSFRGTFLSNFWPAQVTYAGIEYMSVEHAYVAAKVGHVPSLLTCTAGQAKRLGRSRPMLAGFEDGKFLIMAGLLRQKFAIPALRALLQETGDADLVEGNTWGDCYWGVSGGRGKNNLGRLLMWVRAKNAESLEP